MKITPTILFSIAVIVTPDAIAHSDHSHEPPRGTERAAAASGGKAHGRKGDATRISRTVGIELTDKGGCNPPEVMAKQGETLKLVARNAASFSQDLAIGTPGGLKGHAEAIRKFPQMQGTQADRVSVKAGESAELVWEFTNAGQFGLACGRPAEFDAAAAGKVVVSPR